MNDVVGRLCAAEDAPKVGEGDGVTEKVEAGFTPGPWKPDGCLIIAPGFILATVNWHSGYEHGVANARLMAAAPDLYDALNVALGWATGGMDGDWREVDHIQLMRDALAKATSHSQDTPDSTGTRK